MKVLSKFRIVSVYMYIVSPQNYRAGVLGREREAKHKERNRRFTLTKLPLECQSMLNVRVTRFTDARIYMRREKDA